MAKSSKNQPPTTVQCAHCGKRISISEACSYEDFNRERRIEYFCSTACAVANLFKWLKDTENKSEFTLGL